MLTWPNAGVNNYFNYFDPFTSLPAEALRALMTLVAQIDQPHRRAYDQALCTP